MTALLQTRKLTVSIAGKSVCRDFDLSLAPGSVLGVLGPNGAGKTTLLKTLAGLHEPDGGEILLEDAAVAVLPRKRVAQKLGLLLQQHDDPFPATVLETALIGRHPHMDFWRWESHRDVAIARRALKQVHLDGLEQRPQHQLSGGEQRRLAIATILVQNPCVFLLDEPVDQLDLHHQMALLKHFHAKAKHDDRVVVMSLHDVNQAARFCDTLLLLFGNGETAYGPVATLLNEKILSRLYGTPVKAAAWRERTIYLAD